MNTRLMRGSEATTGWRIAAMAAVCGLGLTARDAAAQTWVLNDVLDPPVLPDVDPADNMAFGTAVSVGKQWLVVGAPKADCTTAFAGVIPNTGRIFIYKRTGSGWQYQQSFCAQTPEDGASYGISLDMSGSWFIVGAPYTQVSGQPQYEGVVEFFKLNSTTQTWSRQLVVAGAAAGQLGASVAIDGKLAIAGEEGVNSYRGRVRTWRVDGSTITAEAHYAPAGLPEYGRYGRRVALYSNDCQQPTCFRYLDAMAVLGDNGLHVARRSPGAWVASQTLSAPAGAAFVWGAGLDMNREQIAIQIDVSTPGPDVDCPSGRAVRTFARPSGNTFSLAGDVCPQAGFHAGAFGHSVSVERGTAEVHVGAPAYTIWAATPVPDPEVVSTFAYPADYLDSVTELNLAPSTPGPWVYNDAFGTSVSASSGYMAVGAPWSHVGFASPGIGYVAVYERNTPATPFTP